MGKNQPFEVELNVAKLDAFQILKGLMSSSIPALRYSGQCYTLNTEKCDYRIGCAFLQQQPSGGSFQSGTGAESYPHRRRTNPGK